MSWTQTKNIAPFLSPTPLRPKSMLYDEFSAGNRGLLKHPAKVISRPCLSAAPGADASAIHGRLSAQVALLQSPTLPAAKSGCSQKREFRNVPVDKPHTRLPRFSSGVFGCASVGGPDFAEQPPVLGNAICLPENSPTNIAHKWRANDFDSWRGCFDGLSWC
jgi:hypothetical protein